MILCDNCGRVLNDRVQIVTRQYNSPSLKPDLHFCNVDCQEEYELREMIK